MGIAPRPLLAAAAMLALLSSALLVAAPESPRIEITDPAQGALVGAHFTVSGRVPGALTGTLIWVNGQAAALAKGVFSVVLETTRDGVLIVRAKCTVGKSEISAERSVTVDRTPPVLELLPPAPPESDQAPTQVIRGRVSDPHLARVTMNGDAVKVNPDGSFETSFLVPEIGELTVSVEAVDTLGNRSTSQRVLRRGPGSTPPPAPGAAGAEPADAKDPPDATFSFRKDRAHAHTMGVTPAVERSMDMALRWLSAHQSDDGGWHAADFARWCDGAPATGTQPDGPGQPQYDAGVTGLALAAFLAAGFTPRGAHPYAVTVRRGLRYLTRVQDDQGCFGARNHSHFVYNHAAAALAMIEAFGMTESPLYRGSAQRALDFIQLARNPHGAWRYGVKAYDNDTSVSGWMVMALLSAKRVCEDAIKRGKPVPLSYDGSSLDDAKAWFEKMTDPQYGAVGYIARGQQAGPGMPPINEENQFPSEWCESMTAMGLVFRVLAHEDPRTSDAIRKAADRCTHMPPDWDESSHRIDMHYWYFGTLAMFQVGGPGWREWSRAIEHAVLPNQRSDGDACSFKGSWDPADTWSRQGGRIYSTAMCCLILSTPNRYERVGPAR